MRDFSSSVIGLMSMPGIHPPATRATRASWLRSLSRAWAAPGYWIFTATSRPSRHTARCTCPMEAAAVGVSSKDWNFAVRHRGPSSSASTLCTTAAGRGGADSWSFVRVAR